MKPDIQNIMTFQSPDAWEEWLSQNHATSDEIWLLFYKKNSRKKSIHYAEALDGALCYGWIDGISKSYDEESWIQRFTPRRPKSMWSKRNIEHTKRLIREKKMRPAGLLAITSAKKDGRWDSAYDSSKNMTLPEDFLKKLAKSQEAEAFFKTLNKANTYAIAWRLQTAKKPDTREKRMNRILEMLEKQQKLH